MIDKQKGLITTDFIEFENPEYDKKYSCFIEDNESYGFLFDDNDNIFITNNHGLHSEILAKKFDINIYTNKSNYEKGLKFLQTHTNGRVFVEQEIIVCRMWNILNKKQSLKMIDEFKKRLKIDISDFVYCLSDEESGEKDKNNKSDLYLIKLKDYINCNFSSLEDVKSKYNQLQHIHDFSDRYDAFDMKDKEGRKMGVGKLGYHLTAYQEGKEYKTYNSKHVLRFDEFLV